MMTVFAGMTELERDYIRERQAEEIAIAKKKGKYKGRQPIHCDEYLFQQLYKSWKDGEITQKYMCKKLGVSKTMLYQIINKHN